MSEKTTFKASRTQTVPIWRKIQTPVATLQIPLKLSLLAHAWGGCDTTSATHDKGKLKILRTLKSDIVPENVSCFGNLKATREQIGTATHISNFREEIMLEF